MRRELATLQSKKTRNRKLPSDWRWSIPFLDIPKPDYLTSYAGFELVRRIFIAMISYDTYLSKFFHDNQNLMHLRLL